MIDCHVLDALDLPVLGDWTGYVPGRKLTELPKLIIPNGEAWERNMILCMWVKEVVLASTVVSTNFADVVAKVMEKAKQRYEHQKANPRERH